MVRTNATYKNITNSYAAANVWRSPSYKAVQIAPGNIKVRKDTTIKIDRPKSRLRSVLILVK